MSFELSVEFDNKLTQNRMKRFSLVFDGGRNERVVISGFLLTDDHEILCPLFHLKNGAPFTPATLSPELHKGLRQEIISSILRHAGSLVSAYIFPYDIGHKTTPKSSVKLNTALDDLSEGSDDGSC